MSANDFNRFLTDLRHDEALREEFETLDSNPQTWMRWAATKGYSFTPQEAGRLEEALEISDDDLEKVAGGWCGNEMTTG
jgi:predicted ribosomally synthesized peptide with nif11-like leader